VGVKVYSVIILCLCLMGMSCEKSANQSGTQANATAVQTNASPAIDSASTTTAQANSTSSATVPAKGVIDGCALLTADELKAVQGEAPSESKSSTRPNSAFAVSQCFYTMPTFNKSVSLEVTRNRPDNAAGNVRQFWKERFQEPAEKGAEGEREKERKRGKAEAGKKEERGEREEEEGEAKLTRVTGVGEEAFWGGDARAGVLYVIKNDSILRLSIGGPDDVNVKIQKLKTLAQKALKRLS
jgi:hypothetical protein